MNPEEARDRMRRAVGAALAGRATDQLALEFWGEPGIGDAAPRLLSRRRRPIVIELPGPGPTDLPVHLPRDEQVVAASEWFYGRYRSFIAALEAVVRTPGGVQASWLAS